MGVQQSGQYSCFLVVLGVTFCRFWEDGCVSLVEAGDAERVRVEELRRKDEVGGRMRWGVAGVSVALC
jgi:hypothetical protein